MTRYNSFSYSGGTDGILVTPAFTLPSPSQDYLVKFWMYRDDGYPTNTDLVNVYFNTIPDLTGATLLGTVNRSRTLAPVVVANGWYDYFFVLPSGQNGTGRYVIFEGVSAYGNNMFVDDVCISEACIWTGNVSTEWGNPGNWACGTVPGVTTNVVIPTTPPGGHFPAIAAPNVVDILSMQLEAGAYIDVMPGATLNILHP